MPENSGRSSLDNQRVLVTGASRGLGAEIASAFAAAGADLVISGCDVIGLEKFESRLNDFDVDAMQCRLI